MAAASSWQFAETHSGACSWLPQVLMSACHMPGPAGKKQGVVHPGARPGTDSLVGERDAEKVTYKISSIRDFRGGPVVKDPFSIAGDVSSIPGWGTKILHAKGQLPLCTATKIPHVATKT